MSRKDRVIVGHARFRPGGCRFGDPCDQLATHGRFGPTFCKEHHRLLHDIDAGAVTGYRIHGTNSPDFEGRAAA